MVCALAIERMNGQTLGWMQLLTRCKILRFQLRHYRMRARLQLAVMFEVPYILASKERVSGGKAGGHWTELRVMITKVSVVTCKTIQIVLFITLNDLK